MMRSRQIAMWLVGVMASTMGAAGQCPHHATFSVPFYPSAGEPYLIEFGDLNGDDVTDMVVGGLDYPPIAVHLGLDNGYFQAAVTYEHASSVRSLTIGDLDGDGFDDVVATSRWYGIIIMLSDADGVLQEVAGFPYSGEPGAGIGDLDGDGDLDIAVAGGDDGLVLLRNHGDATFTEETVWFGELSGYAVEVVDLDVDEDLDVAVAMSDIPFIYTFFNDGEGNFEPILACETAETPFWMIADDFNDDGAPDFAAAPYDEDVVTVLINNSDGSYWTPTQYEVVRGTRYLASGDVTGEGDVDLIVSSAGNGQHAVCVFTGLGDGTFEPYADYPSRTPRGMAVADYDRDGLNDIIVAQYRTGFVTVMLNQSQGHFRPSNEHEGMDGDLLVPGDLDGDGLNELITAYWLSAPHEDRINVYTRGDEGGYDATVYTSPLDEPQLATGDVDGDGRTDIVAFNPDSVESYLFLSEEDGSLGDPIVVETLPEPSDLLIASLDGNPGAELAVPRGDQEVIEVAANDGAGNFTPWLDVPVGLRMNSYALADIDDDGDIDILAAGERSPGYLSVTLNAGDGNFDAPALHNAGDDANGLVLGDINGDGLPDAFLRNGVGADGSILLNDGLGGFHAAIPYTIPVPRVDQVLAGDFDGDGFADLAFAGQVNWPEPEFQHSTPVVFGHGDGAFSQPFQFHSAEMANCLVKADINGDARLDLIAHKQQDLGRSAMLYNLCRDDCPGDVDGDGVTNQADLGILLVSYEIPSDHPLYDPRADLNGDGSVGQPDLGVLLADYECGL